MTDIALSIQNVKKEYKNGLTALKNVSLEIKKGDFFALLGPNGAGKSTLIGILTSLVNKSSGLIKVFDVDIDKNFALAKNYIGVVPQEFNFDIFQTVEQIIENQAGYFGVEKDLAKKRSQYYLKKLDLFDKKDQQARMLSGGMKRRLMIARALVHDPKILILDEPTAGVDLELRRSMWEFIEHLNTQGITIILTTHYLEEAEQMAKNIAIIDKGEIIVNKKTKELLKDWKSETLILETAQIIDKIPIINNIKIKIIDKQSLEIVYEKNNNLTDILIELNKKGVQVTNIKNKYNRLEELFLEFTRNKQK